MRPDFDLAYDQVLPHEGNWSQDPDDPGGQTLLGTTRRDWSFLKCWSAVVDPWLARGKTGPHPWEDPATREECRWAALNGYWARTRAGEIENQALATVLMDTSFNIGVHGGVSLLQRSLNFMNRNYDGGLNLYPELVVDGGMGGVSLKACGLILARNEGHILFGHFGGLRVQHYQALMLKATRKEKYQGWIARALSFQWSPD